MRRGAGMRVPRPPPLPNHTWPDWLVPLAPLDEVSGRPG